MSGRGRAGDIERLKKDCEGNSGTRLGVKQRITKIGKNATKDDELKRDWVESTCLLEGSRDIGKGVLSDELQGSERL